MESSAPLATQFGVGLPYLNPDRIGVCRFGRYLNLGLLQPNTNSFGRTAGFAAGFLSVAFALAAGFLSAAAGFVAFALAAGFLSAAGFAVAFVLADAVFGRPDVEPASNFDCINARIPSAVFGI